MSKNLIHHVAKVGSKKILETHNINSKNSQLEYVNFRVIKMRENQTFKLKSQTKEFCLVMQYGSIEVNSKKNNKKYSITRSKNIFEKVPCDSLYVGQDDFIVIKSIKECEFVIAIGDSRQALPTILIKAESIKVEHRGMEGNYRTVFNILDDQSRVASNLLVVEVFTNAANWSSYPPHKHDTPVEGIETQLEETYYHKVCPENGFVLQRIYDKTEKPFDNAYVVKNEDVIIVKSGFHPVSVPPSNNSYYLNIMAGPIRKWKFTNDPDFGN